MKNKLNLYCVISIVSSHILQISSITLASLLLATLFSDLISIIPVEEQIVEAPFCCLSREFIFKELHSETPLFQQDL